MAPCVWLWRGANCEGLAELTAGRLTIGRTGDYKILDSRISSKHISLTVDGNAVLACDTSTNGTFLNGERMVHGKAIALKDGDVLSLVIMLRKQPHTIPTKQRDKLIATIVFHQDADFARRAMEATAASIRHVAADAWDRPRLVLSRTESMPLPPYRRIRGVKAAPPAPPLAPEAPPAAPSRALKEKPVLRVRFPQDGPTRPVPKHPEKYACDTSVSPAKSTKGVSDKPVSSLHEEPKPCFMIDPRTSTFLANWDTACGIALSYTALACPFEVAFLGPETNWHSGRFWINRIIDLFFLFDMFMQIIIMYAEEPKWEVDHRKQVLVRAGLVKKIKVVQMITRIDKTTLRYLRTWFLIDFLSIITVVFDILPVFDSSLSEQAVDVAQETASGSSSVGEPKIDPSLKILRFLRVLRLVKLVRVVKASRLIKRWQTSISLDFSTQTLIKCLVVYLLAAHWFACLLVLGTTLLADSPLHTWRGTKGYCVRTADNPNERRSASFLPGKTWELQPPTVAFGVYLADVWCVGPWDLWILSFYWTIMIISGASGGDTDSDMMSPPEALLFTFIVVIACLLNGNIIAWLCDVLSNMHPESIAFRNNMDQLNHYSRMNKLARPTRAKLREFLYRAKHVQMGNAEKHLMSLLSHKLQGELSIMANGPWLTKVPFLRGVEVAVTVRISLALEPMVFVPMELISADSMYHLSKGTVVDRGKVLIGGSIWGTDCILSRTDLRAPGARALAYADVLRVTREALLGIITEQQIAGMTNYGEPEMVCTYPLAAAKLHWVAIKVALASWGTKVLETERARLALNKNQKSGNWSEMLNGLGNMEALNPNEVAEAEAMARHLAKLEAKAARRKLLSKSVTRLRAIRSLSPPFLKKTTFPTNESGETAKSRPRCGDMRQEVNERIGGPDMSTTDDMEGTHTTRIKSRSASLPRMTRSASL